MNIQMNMKYISAEENGTMNYAVFYPDHYEDLPLMMYLHGAGERGKNFEDVYRYGVSMHIAEGKVYPAVVIIPQCPAEYVWDNLVRELKVIIDKTAEEFSIKPDRICITGSSMGGFGTWSMGLTYPNFFSGIAPICGGGMAWRTRNLCTTPVYAVHGKKDPTVLPVCSEMMVDGVNQRGGNARLVILEDGDHASTIIDAYAKMDVVDWLLEQRRTDMSPLPEAYLN